jgi:hypothetical protein
MKFYHTHRVSSELLLYTTRVSNKFLPYIHIYLFSNELLQYIARVSNKLLSYITQVSKELLRYGDF